MTGRPVDLERRKGRQNAFLAAFEETGTIAEAARRSGVVFVSHHHWVKIDPEYAARFTELKARTPVPSPKPHPSGYRIKGKRAEVKAEKQRLFLEALAKTGIIGDALKEANSSLGAFQGWRASDPEFEKLVYEVITRAKADGTRDSIIRERLRVASKAGWDDPAKREAQRQRQVKIWTEEKRQKQREQAKGRWKRMSDEERTAFMQRARDSQRRGMITRIEALTLKALTERRISSMVHFPVSLYEADIYIESLNLVLECDGKFWHGVPGRSEYDSQRDAAMEDLGYTVIRLTEEEIIAGNWSRLDAAITACRENNV